MQRRYPKPTSLGYSKLSSIINSMLLIVIGIIALFVIYWMFKYNFLAFFGLNIIYTTIAIFCFLMFLVLIIKKKIPKTTTLLMIIYTLFLGVTAIIFYYSITVANGLNKTTSYSEIEMSIVVPKDSTITDVSELQSVETPLSSDMQNITSLLSDIKSTKNVDLETTSVDSYQTAYENLINGSSNAMVLNSAYSSLLELTDANYASQLKTIYTYKITKETNSTTATTKNTTGVFNIYISGIDTYGEISTVSRSDVNIIMTVNMNTHKILLTTTPRDAYVKIPDGGADQYDKLTHAGIYGVETSMKTLENLYGINIDYYTRLNFTSFLKLIDLIGGIEVYNDQAFTSLHGNYDFPVGKISLNSDQALGYIRERYSLSGGDNDRGKNQEKVIAAIINKITSVNSLSKITDIANNLQDSVQTNMTIATLNQLLNSQLSSGTHFTVDSQSVTGTGSTGELVSYAMPTAQLYMMQLDESSIQTAEDKINAVMEGR